MQRMASALPRIMTASWSASLPGKPEGMTGAEVEKYYRDGHIREIAEYSRAMC